MQIYENVLYIEDLEYVANLDLSWDKLKNSSILISGATGLIGSFIVDTIMLKNKKGLNCKIYALGRNKEKAEKRFLYGNEKDDLFECVQYDINKPLVRDDIGKIGYVLHLASNTHPMQYATDPIGTITTNVFGTYNMLEFAHAHDADRSLFTSSNEIYGENRGDVEMFDEDYCGYINSNTLRAGYPESKRVSEALCQAYISQKNMDIVIPRPTRSYGPNLLKSDTKALTQFLTKAVNGEDIVLKSEGKQYYSYQYVADTVAGIFTIMLDGEKGEAYNIADESSDIRLKDLASYIAAYVGKDVVFEIPDQVEASGYSTATKARLDGSKLRSLGWKPKYSIKEGLERTIDVLKVLDNWK